ncbi:MAG: DNA cytosine methyltransferase [Bacteroides sp.]|nr:DNA cytosine methyltransferase [Bacteroides sp.]
MEKFRLGELFCGPGGLAYGALTSRSANSQYGVVHVWSSDYDRDSCETYANNLCPESPETVICEDVRNLDIDALKDIDAFAYGFPCNSFSQVSKHKGLANEKFGQLYWYGIRVMQRFRPKWFIAENVSGIRSAGSNDFNIILNDMNAVGYNLTVHLYKAEEYGVPQTRHRVIIVGIRNDLDIEFKVPAPTTKSSLEISSRVALSNIPRDVTHNEIRELSSTVTERLSYIKPGQNIWQAEENIPEHLRIKTQTRISQIYRKLDPEKPSYTITASGGGGTFGYHWENRELTNRERARIQTFPDWYDFVGKYSSVRKQIGMAVPCKLANIVVTAILNSFAGIPYDSIEPNIK